MRGNKIKELFDKEMKSQRLHQYPPSKVGKYLRQNSPKEGIEFEEMVLSYLHFIANSLFNQQK